jgi:hydrogenase nickel incorporation protein HypA/HybF
MHELSIALSLIELAQQETTSQPGRVVALHVKVGPLSGVAPDALRFSYEIATQDTPLAGSELVIEETPVVVFCDICRAQHEVRSSHWFICPHCGTPTPDVRRGRELELVALEIDQ